MDLVIAVILCNCTLTIGCVALTCWTLHLRRQVVDLGDLCDRWSSDCDWLSGVPASIAASRVQLDRLGQLYQQQLVTLDRLRAMALVVGIARSLAEPILRIVAFRRR